MHSKTKPLLDEFGPSFCVGFRPDADTSGRGSKVRPAFLFNDDLPTVPSEKVGPTFSCVILKSPIYQLIRF